MSAGRHGSNFSLRISNSKGSAAEGAVGGVDPGAIGLELGPQVRVEVVLLALGEIADAEGAHQPVARQARLAGDLREAPAGRPAVEVHLPEPVLGVDEPLGEPEVRAARRGDVGNAPAIPGDLDRRADPGGSKAALELRQRSAQQPVPGRGGGSGAQRGTSGGDQQPGAEAAPDRAGAHATPSGSRPSASSLPGAPAWSARPRDAAPPGRRPRPRRAAPDASARRARARRATAARASSGARRTPPASPRGR